MTMEDTKTATDRIEDYEVVKPQAGQDEPAPYPPCLHGLNDGELKRLGRKTTFKLDLFVMPAMTIMYILNYLGSLSGR